MKRLEVAYSRTPGCQDGRELPPLPSAQPGYRRNDAYSVSCQVIYRRGVWWGVQRWWRAMGGGYMQSADIDPKGSFLKNLVLSVLLLGLSSFLIPIVLKQIDDQKFVDQQRFQAELSRQDKIIDEQAEVLDTLAAGSGTTRCTPPMCCIRAMNDMDGTTGTNEPSTRITCNPARCWGRCGPRSARCYGWPRDRPTTRFCGCTKTRCCLLIPACSN